MMTMILDQPRAFGQFLAEWTRRSVGLFRPTKLWASFIQSSVHELVLVPQDIRTADPLLAQEFYNGVYSFGGQRVETKGNDPFRIHLNKPDISDEWQRELQGFRWLRHLHASSNAISNSHAQALLSDWINACGKPKTGIAWLPEIAAQRLIAWLSHSTILVEQADIKLYKRYLKSINIHIRFLRNGLADTTDGMPKLQVQIALAYAALCVRLQRAPRGGAANKPHEALGNVLSRQIYADGGHVTRCASLLPEILADLLPLRQSYEKLGIAPPLEMLNAIDRMMPAIRYYRHRDGSFARFNGVASSQQDLLATVLRYDDAMGEPTQEAAQSGYQRLVAGPTTLLMDVGKPPKGEFSTKAHAGCLSFEMSSLRTCFITNCGSPEMGPDTSDDAMISASRSTAAHSTATLHDTSSCRFHKGQIFRRYLGDRILAGPGRVISERNALEGFTQLVARHDGYLRQFGVWHERILQLSNDGNVLYGRDKFYGKDDKAPKHLTRDDCVIRFHLHPSVSAKIDPDSGTIVIHASENQSWKFNCDSNRVALEESIFFANKGGPVSTTQIVLNLELAQLNEVNWNFTQTIGTRQQ